MKQETLYLSTFERWAREDGLEEGRKDGRLEGRQQTAKRMLSMGLTREQIQQATELSESELVALEKEWAAEQD